ncbi:c-type cytochrome [Marinibacterium sp. SX1]|uniref:c-type cytochrome n=1 Tax=Marinibacterium sp. SX1 TaxID=3388424 RepID=UPI003D17AFBA
MPVAVFRPGPTPAAAPADGRPGHGAVVRLAGGRPECGVFVRRAGNRAGRGAVRRLACLIITLSLGAPAAAQDFTTLKGHGGPVMGIAVAPDGRIATASFDNSVGLWQDGVPGWLEGHAAAVTALVFTPDGGLVSAGDDFTIHHWPGPLTAATPPAPRVIGRHQGKIQALAVTPDGRWLASGSWDGTLRLWPLSPGEEGASGPSSAASDASGLPSATPDAPGPSPSTPGGPRLSPGEAGPPRSLHAPGSGINALALSSDGTRLHAATTAGEILAYDLTGPDDAPPLPLVRHGFGVNELIAGPGWLAYGAVDGGTRVIDPATGAALADFSLDRRPILAMAFHPATGQLAVGDGQGYIMVVDTRDWRIARDYRATRKGPVWALAFSPDGAMLYAGGLDDVAYGWPVALLEAFDATMGQERSFLREAGTMSNGERQFMRKCSICHALDDGPSRKAGPTLYGLFGRRAGSVAGYAYSPVLDGSDIVWQDATIDALFDAGPDHYIPGSKMPMQVIAAPDDRADLIDFLREATKKD